MFRCIILLVHAQMICQKTRCALSQLITLGRYVIFYNERLPGVKYPDGYMIDSVYTELCEVTVHGKSINNPF